MNTDTPNSRQYLVKQEDDDLSNPHTPYLFAPSDWDENGISYGAWCRCVKCGYIGQSTVAYDFYADGPGEVFKCETCSREDWKKIVDAQRGVKVKV
jgi:hypothetical protein